MKKIIVFLMALCLIVCMTVPVFAVTPKLEIDMPEIPDISGSVKIDIPDSFWDKWFADHPIRLPDDFEIQEPTEPDSTEPVVAELDAPVISTAKYVHKTPYYGMHKHLEIEWDAVEGAESYEALITKADGETITYTTKNTSVYDKNAECPKVYIEASSKWASASVQVRAVCGDSVGEWSEAVKIGCDMIH